MNVIILYKVVMQINVVDTNTLNKQKRLSNSPCVSIGTAYLKRLIYLKRKILIAVKIEHLINTLSINDTNC